MRMIAHPKKRRKKHKKKQKQKQLLVVANILFSSLTLALGMAGVEARLPLAKMSSEDESSPGREQSTEPALARKVLSDSHKSFILLQNLQSVLSAPAFDDKIRAYTNFSYVKDRLTRAFQVGRRKLHQLHSIVTESRL